MFGVIINARIRITGNLATEPEKRQCLNHSSHFSRVVGVRSGTLESKMSLGGDDKTKHIIYSSMERSCDDTPSN